MVSSHALAIRLQSYNIFKRLSSVSGNFFLDLPETFTRKRDWQAAEGGDNAIEGQDGQGVR